MDYQFLICNIGVNGFGMRGRRFGYDLVKTFQIEWAAFFLFPTFSISISGGRNNNGSYSMCLHCAIYCSSRIAERWVASVAVLPYRMKDTKNVCSYDAHWMTRQILEPLPTHQTPPLDSRFAVALSGAGQYLWEATVSHRQYVSHVFVCQHFDCTLCGPQKKTNRNPLSWHRIWKQVTTVSTKYADRQHCTSDGRTITD